VIPPLKQERAAEDDAPASMNDPLSRRRFLKRTAFGVVTLGVGRFIPAVDSGINLPLEIAERLEFFSPHEYLVMRAIAERIVGVAGNGEPDATHLGVALRADKFLAGADPEIQEQFHQLLTVFNGAFFAFLFDFRFSSFVRMNAEDQDSYLLDWMTSVIGFRRTAFQALKRTCLSMFYTEPRSWKEIGFDGMDVPRG
jgi:hypothetical protein